MGGGLTGKSLSSGWPIVGSTCAARSPKEAQVVGRTPTGVAAEEIELRITAHGIKPARRHRARIVFGRHAELDHLAIKAHRRLGLGRAAGDNKGTIRPR
jgi:hypothetical protein